MPPRDQIPRMCDLLTPAVDALLGDLAGQDRAARELYANHGRYGDILRGWRGQAEVWRARLTREVIARRRTLAHGEPLKDLAKSEFFAELPPDPQFAEGEAYIFRSSTNANPGLTGNFVYGVIPSGTRFKVAADPLFIVPIQDAEYTTSAAAVCGVDDTDGFSSTDNGDGTFSHYQYLTVPIIATREGEPSNVPHFVGINTPLPVFADTLFAKFSVDSFFVAGGSSGVVDEQLSALALAMGTGSFGPNHGALVAGALTNPGVRRAVYVEDTRNAVAQLFVADASWATSARARAIVKQRLQARPWIGWGCRVDVLGVVNQGIVVRPNILLRGKQFDSDRIAITEAVRLKLVDYFDNRPDWYTWRLDAIGGVVAGADSRILACSSVSVVTDKGALIAAVDEANFVTGAEPSALPVPYFGTITHYSLVRQAVDPTYSVPG